MTTTISYPSALPPAQLSGLGTASAEQTIRSQTDTGPAKVRRRTSSNIIPLSGSLVISEQQKDILEDFYYTTLLGGSLVFRMIDPVRGFEAEYRFTAPPSIVPMSTRTASGYKLRASLSLEQLPPTTGILIVSGGATCILMQGTAGAVDIANNSDITLSTSGFCVEDGVVSNLDTDQYTFDYARTNTEDGENVSIDWEYTDVNGTSIITYHRDTGWSYTLDDDHAGSASASCGSGDHIRKLSGDESGFPGFRNFSIEALEDNTASTLCMSNSGLRINPVFYQLTTTATLDNKACPTPPSRAQGFRDYTWACSTQGVFQDANGEVIPSNPA